MKKVAIACQGGGSHAAFGAGVLRRLLTSPEHGRSFRVTALTGTSGGALCAGLAWSRLITKPDEKKITAAEQGKLAADALSAFWEDLACESWDVGDWSRAIFRQGPFDYADASGNAFMVAGMRANPYGQAECRIASRITRCRMLELLERHIPQRGLTGKSFKKPVLRIGATNILEGFSAPIEVEKHPAAEIHAILLASASIPPLFKPAVLDGEYYWDGLFSHNPPIDCLTNLDAADKPEEIWVIRINPEKANHPPSTPAQVVDRRNEFCGNLSLAGELYHIDAMNWLLRSEKVPDHVRAGLKKVGYEEITLRVVGLPEKLDLDFASKYDRSRELMEMLIKEGEKAAPEFFEKKSIWSMHEVEGVYKAAVDPQQTGSHRKHSVAQPSSVGLCPTINCPAISICNTNFAVDSLAEQAYDFAQTYLEHREKP